MSIGDDQRKMNANRYYYMLMKAFMHKIDSCLYMQIAEKYRKLFTNNFPKTIMCMTKTFLSNRTAIHTTACVRNYIDFRKL